MKVFIIKEEVFKTEILFVCDCDNNEFVKYFNKRFNKKIEVDKYVIGTVIKVDNNYFRVVWSKDFKKKNLPEIIHELFHLVVRILEDKGVPIKANIETGECGDETAAYLLEFYVEKILKKLIN